VEDIRVSLPWFPFNIKDFLANTKRLNTEAKGAYLCLMLDYYEQEGPAPDDDDVLAAICELPVDAWKRHRKVIAPLFQIKDGFWHHDRIEHEIESGNNKLAQSKARAQAGAAAMHTKRGHKLASSNQQAKPTASVSASSELEAKLKQSLEAAPLHLPIKDSLSVDVLTVEKDNSGDNSQDLPQEPVALDIGTPVDPRFWPCANHISACRFDGADDTIIKREVEAFIAVKQQDGALSKDWDASWSLWWKRWKDHRDALAAKEAAKAAPKPRIEVSNKIDWEAHAKRFAGGMGWPRGVGPDPESPACRCPPDILQRHGIAVLATVKEKT
jgi:uncharacterized protein YdaU (DUF1376 family)